MRDKLELLLTSLARKFFDAEIGQQQLSLSGPITPRASNGAEVRLSPICEEGDAANF